MPTMKGKVDFCTDETDIPILAFMNRAVEDPLTGIQVQKQHFYPVSTTDKKISKDRCLYNLLGHQLPFQKLEFLSTQMVVFQQQSKVYTSTKQ